MDWENVAHLTDDLAVPVGRLGSIARPRREASIAEAVAFPCGPSQDRRHYTRLYGPFNNLDVAVGKPGKEADPARSKPNLHDMTPSLRRAGEDIGYRPSFGDLFSAIQEYALGADFSGDTSLQVLGALLFRNAFMLDHVETQAGIWRYHPPLNAVAYLEAANPLIGEIPVRAFLHLIEALALNEDVKYNPPGRAVGAAGRQKSLLTCAHMTAVFLNLASIGQFVDGMTRGRGVAPLAQQAGIDIFRLLRWPTSQGTKGFEREVLRQFEQVLGKTVFELADIAQIASPGVTYKSRVAYVFNKLLSELLGSEMAGQLRESFNVKTIRILDNGMPAEDISFPSIRQDAIVTQSWLSSDLRRTWQRPFLFAVFSRSDAGEERLLGMSFCSIPVEDLDTRAQESWRRTAKALLHEQRSACPKRSETDFFVRCHSSRKRISPDGEDVTPLAFWLSRSYVRALMGGRDARGIGIYGG